MNTFCVQTLGCKVNHYESDQIAAVLRSYGLVETDASHADLRVVNTCSVTVESDAKSRQLTRRLVRLPLLQSNPGSRGASACGDLPRASEPLHILHNDGRDPFLEGKLPPHQNDPHRPRVIVTGCWATGNRAEAKGLTGVDAVITHHDDVALQLRQLLDRWEGESRNRRDGDNAAARIEPDSAKKVNFQMAPGDQAGSSGRGTGTFRLPLLDSRQTGRQRAFLKVQDGCDAHCTYCIIPQLRPTLWSKPAADVVEEARRLVAAGHVEIVLTGVFLIAYGRQTALRRRREAGGDPLSELIRALCTGVSGLGRLRLSSLEPGDLGPELLSTLRDHPQVVPHFHLPLQSGSDTVLRRMNRQYRRDDFLRMIDRVFGAFDRPALTTDVIAGFPGETDEDFGKTLQVVDYARFIHVHAFPYSPRPGTAAERWKDKSVHGSVAAERIERLQSRAAYHDLAFRRQFVGEAVELLVENGDGRRNDASYLSHGRCERYFDVHFSGASARPGDFVRVRVDEVTPRRTHGTLVSAEPRQGGAP